MWTRKERTVSSVRDTVLKPQSEVLVLAVLAVIDNYVVGVVQIFPSFMVSHGERAQANIWIARSNMNFGGYG
jgi:hypothetical protein